MREPKMFVVTPESDKDKGAAEICEAILNGEECKEMHAELTMLYGVVLRLSVIYGINVTIGLD